MATKLKGESNEKDAYFNRALESAAPDLLASAGMLPKASEPQQIDEDDDDDIAPSELAVAMGFPSAKEYMKRKNGGPVMIQSSTSSQHVSEDGRAEDALQRDKCEDGDAAAEERIAALQARLDEKEDQTHDRDDIEDSELKRLREARLKMLKDSQIWSGSYSEISQDEFLPTVTQASRVVCHFYHNDFERCKLMDKHLTDLSRQYRTTRFVKLNAEKAAFFVTKLAIRTLPTLVFFKDGIAVDRLLGFEGLGATDQFPSAALARRLAVAGVIDAPSLMKKKAEKISDMIGGQKISNRLGKSTSAQAKLKARDADSDDEDDEDD